MLHRCASFGEREELLGELHRPVARQHEDHLESGEGVDEPGGLGSEPGQPLVGLSRQIGAVRETLSEGPARARRAIGRIEIMLTTTAITLKGREGDSLYNAEVLRDWLKRRRSN